MAPRKKKNPPDAEDLKQADRYYYAAVAFKVSVTNFNAASYHAAGAECRAAEKYLKRRGQVRLIDGLWDLADLAANAIIGADVFGYPDPVKIAEKRAASQKASA